MKITKHKLLSNISPHLFVAASAWISRIIISVVQLICIRFLISGLGTEKYALFAILTGLTGWYLLTDMGVGYSLQNYISEFRSKNKSYNNYVAVAACLSLIVFSLVLIVLYFVSPYIAIRLLKQFSFFSNAEKIRAFLLVGILLTGTSIGGISYKIWYAKQKGYLSNIIPAIASLISLAGIIIISKCTLPNKLFLSLIFFTGPTAILACVSFVFQMFQIKKEHWKMNLAIFSKLMKRAFHFWTFAIMSAAVLQIDYIVMSQFVSPKDIVIYNIATKVYTFVFFIYSSVLMAFWPVCTEMIAKNNWSYVITESKKYIKIGIGIIIFFIICFIIFAPNIVRLFSPNYKVIIPISFIIILGIYQIIRIWSDTFSMILQSVSFMKPFWIWVPIQAILCILFEWFFARSYGIYGIVCGLIASYVLTVVWVLPKYVYRYLKNTR